MFIDAQQHGVYLFYTVKKGKKNVNDIVYALPTGLPIDNKLEPIKMQEYVINAWSAFAALVTEIKSYWPSKTYTC